MKLVKKIKTKYFTHCTTPKAHIPVVDRARRNTREMYLFKIYALKRRADFEFMKAATYAQLREGTKVSECLR